MYNIDLGKPKTSLTITYSLCAVRTCKPSSEDCNTFFIILLDRNESQVSGDIPRDLAGLLDLNFTFVFPPTQNNQLLTSAVCRLYFLKELCHGDFADFWSKLF